MAWWSINTVTDVDDDVSSSVSGYVNENAVAALIPYQFDETTWYISVVGPNIPANSYLNTSSFPGVTDARTGIQLWTGGRSD